MTAGKVSFKVVGIVQIGETVPGRIEQTTIILIRVNGIKCITDPTILMADC